MKRNFNPARLYFVLVTVLVYSAIFIVGLRYSFYKIFSQFRFYDDEGTMMLRVQAFIEDPATYDSLSGMYGPFYYLHKYAIYSALQTNVSHDINRFTTIVLWGLIAAACAFLVHRVSRSIVLAAIVQMQLIVYLAAFANEPGHPHEVGLVLIGAALVLSTFVTTSRSSFVSMAGLGAVTAALLLVKVNLGIFLVAPLSLAVLRFLPRSKLVLGLSWLAAAVALVLPTALMWRHLDMRWGQNYCALVTLVIASSLVASSRRSERGELRWADVGVALGAAAITVGAVCALIVGWGSSLSAVANSVFLRAATLPSSFVISAPITQNVVKASAASFLLAVGYTLAARTIRGRKLSIATLSIVKLAYAGFALYSVNYYADSVLLRSIPIPFIWLVLAEPNAVEKTSIRELFPRIFLCLLAAFQTLQAYPVHGSQARWAAFLIVPLAAICIGDAVRGLWDVVDPGLRRTSSWGRLTWLQPTLSLLLVCGIGTAYYGKANLTGVATAYAQRSPLGMPGSSRIRLLPSEVGQIRWTVERIKSHCDGFIGLPGFASMYFWTEIPPPGTINNGWIFNLGNARQLEVIETMRTYERPCVLRNMKAVRFWTGGRPLDSQKPLIRYIQTNYKSVVEEYGAYSLLVTGDRSIGVGPREEGT